MTALRAQADLALYDVQYQCIAMDPPWPERGGGKSKRGADRHYPVMSVPAIVDLVRTSEPVSRMAGTSHAWVWVTDNYLRGGLEVLDACGFRYVRTFVWVKLRDVEGTPEERLEMKLGQYGRGSHELLLFGVRGADMRPEPANRPRSVFFAPTGQHSAKPAKAYTSVIERVSPGPRVEMFARAPRPGWAVWGNEV